MTFSTLHFHRLNIKGIAFGMVTNSFKNSCRPISWTRFLPNRKLKNMHYGMSQVRFHGNDAVDPNAKSVHITFVRKDDSEQVEKFAF